MQTIIPSIYRAKELGVKLYCELILDSVHHTKQKSIEGMGNFGHKAVAVTDNIGVGPNSKAEWFKICGKKAIIDPSNKLAIWSEGYVGNKLFGSRATTMDHMLPYILEFLKGPLHGDSDKRAVWGPLNFEERMDKGLHLLCKAPAERIAVDDRKGILAKDYDADIVVLNINEGTAVHRVFVGGKEVLLN
jgi:N-acetylglucosamine-6-phosphate deacetylase